MESVQIEVTKKLLEINTIKIQPTNPFTWASGWKSPIYCDNRKILSYPETRTFIRDRFVDVIKEKYPEVEVIAGVATGAIAIGALVADKLGLPFIYIRSKPKDHGLENLIEGDLNPNQKVVVVEDLVSTGISSLNAAEAVNNYGGVVIGMVAIFTYNFKHAIDNFKKANIELTALSRYQILIDTAVEIGEITSDQVETLMKWREDPSNWGK
ncbi:MAG TPA: orotate phosphoribosyltransferase [Draconibacterium sp.]|jgi:orotate phosphoribosyltransferase|nr:orotate phosphoribosyltransferase [Draconibacterium sp.]